MIYGIFLIGIIQSLEKDAISFHRTLPENHSIVEEGTSPYKCDRGVWGKCSKEPLKMTKESFESPLANYMYEVPILKKKNRSIDIQIIAIE